MGIFFVLFLFVVSFGGERTQNEKKGIIKIKVYGFDNRDGSLLIALHNSSSSFPGKKKKRDEKPYKKLEMPIEQDTIMVVFKDVPFGTYAVVLLHDENDNKRLDMGFLGPAEDYGFSNNVRGTFGPPDFKDCEFSLSTDSVLQEIEVK